MHLHAQMKMLPLNSEFRTICTTIGDDWWKMQIWLTGLNNFVAAASGIQCGKPLSPHFLLHFLPDTGL